MISKSLQESLAMSQPAAALCAGSESAPLSDVLFDVVSGNTHRVRCTSGLNSRASRMIRNLVGREPIRRINFKHVADLNEGISYAHKRDSHGRHVK